MLIRIFDKKFLSSMIQHADILESKKNKVNNMNIEEEKNSFYCLKGLPLKSVIFLIKNFN